MRSETNGDEDNGQDAPGETDDRDSVGVINQTIHWGPVAEVPFFTCPGFTDAGGHATCEK